MNTTIQITTQEALDALPLGTKLRVKAPQSWFCPKGYTTTLTQRAEGFWANTVGSKITLRFVAKGTTYRPPAHEKVLDVGGTAFIEGPSRGRRRFYGTGRSTYASHAVITVK